MSLTVIIIAAGKGTRMRSSLPKVLHLIGGKPIISHVIDCARKLSPAKIAAVIGHGADIIREQIPAADLNWVIQEEQLGTGHAVLQAENFIGDDVVLILFGDVPLITPDTLNRLVTESGASGFALLTAVLDEPAGYGRIIRNNSGNIAKIVEHRDSSSVELAVKEVNTGIMAVRGGLLKKYLTKLSNANSQREYYLTDVIEMAVQDGIEVHALVCPDWHECLGINDRSQQAQLERYYQRGKAESLMRAGLGFADPARVDIRGELTAGLDVFIDINAVFVGKVVLGNNVSIGPNCVIKDSEIGSGSVIHANTVIEDSRTGENCRIGPFARLRPGSELKGENNIGNFVEIKKSSIDRGSKANHLSYVGDTLIGKNCNLGAGTITCNYDGAYKHQTVIGDNVFIGSDTQLVAPVSIGDNVTVGAGTTLTANVQVAAGSRGALVISRVRQKVINGWVRPAKN